MRGYPKHINTKADLELVQRLWPGRAAKAVQAMLDNTKTWQPGKMLTQGEAGKEDATHKVVEQTEEGGHRVQMELVEDPHSRLTRLGLSKGEAQAIVAAGLHAR